MSTVSRKDIAIIGMACRFPHSENYRDYWENLLARRNCISEIPETRWDWRRYGGDPVNDMNKNDSRWGGFVDDVDCFDYRFFGISPNTAEVMDPQQRIMLELSWACMEDAGVIPQALAGRKVGVFLGAFNFDYKELLEKYERPIEAYQSTGTANAIIANRVSHFYDFRGPSLTLDTACSASIYAVHSALQSLGLGESELALAGGVNLILTPSRHILFSKTGMLSPTGSSKSFDAAADGYVRSEGAGILLLKPLEAALDDNDCIHGILKGSAVNHCGKTHTLTYPDSSAQSRVIAEAMKNAQVDASTVSYVEAHGTGTPKGDPIEIQGLISAYGKTNAVEYCAIGSAKSNIGHLEAAAGVAGIIKVLLSMKAKTLPALANFVSLNPRINLANSPFYMLDSTRPWQPLTGPDGAVIPRRAGVSSFGFGGTNGHVILEEAPVRNNNKASSIVSETDHLFVFSAKTLSSLSRYLHNMREWLAKNQNQPLVDISSTLLNRRTHFEHRVAIIASSVVSLENLLQVAIDSIANGACGDEPICNSDTALDGDARTGLLSSAAHWLKTGCFDSQTMFESSVRVAGLPTYVFEKTRCWIDREDEKHVDKNTNRTAFANENLSENENMKSTSEGCVNDGKRGVGKRALAAVWKPVDDADLVQTEAAAEVNGNQAGKICVVGAHLQYRKDLQKKYEDALFFDADENPQHVLRSSSVNEVTHFIWITPVQDDMGLDLVFAKQKEQLDGCFSWLRHFLNRSIDSEPITLSLVTVQGFKSAESEQISASNAALAGLFGSIAREYSRANVRVFDILPDTVLPVNVIANTRISFDGPRLLRHGRWLERRFVPVSWSDIGPMPENIRETCIRDGVYLIVGGAGGIGQALSEYMIKHCQARVIWLGRRAVDDRISAAIERLSKFGWAPEYVQVDATDFRALRAAYDQLVSRFGRVNGVINAAMVFKTCSFKDMSITDFEHVYAVKAGTSINLARILAHENIDYLINFSSINSFITAADQSHYAAGSVFQDALSAQMQSACKYKVKTINWGYWTTDGALAGSDIFQKWRKGSGVGDLTIDDAVLVIEKTLRSSLQQVVFINAQTQQANLPNTDMSRSLKVDLDGVKNYLERGAANRVSMPPAKGLAGGLKFQASDEVVVNYMWLQLVNSGLIEADTFTQDSIIRQFKNICSSIKAAYLQRWLNKSIQILCDHGVLEMQVPVAAAGYTGQPVAERLIRVTDLGKRLSKESDIVDRWAQRKAEWTLNPATAAQANLLGVTLEALPEIIRGERLSPQVMFPASSMDLLEGIYKNNPVSDYFNLVVAEITAHAVANLYRDHRKAKIIEIGAGTGGTSAVVFRRLRPVQNQLEEYCYTDISRAFLVHAQEHFKSENAFLSTKIFNVELPTEEQNVDGGTYDIVIATNVLHATKNIHRTLRHAKALLKPGGLMILNELSEDSVFCHMTFGLLEGWWLHEDSELRIPDCPGLTSLGWKRALEQEGYLNVEFPQLVSHSLGQQIILARSNGVVLGNSIDPEQEIQEQIQVEIRPSAADPLPTVFSQSPKTETIGVHQTVEKAAMNGHLKSENLSTKNKGAALDTRQVKETIRSVVATSLKYNIEEVQMNESFADYGVDSITSVNVVQSLNKALKIDLYSTCLFDYTNIARLAEYIVDHYGHTNTEIPSTDERPHSDSSAPAEPLSDHDAIVAMENSDRSNRVRQPDQYAFTDIAIIGASGRFGKASNLGGLWSALANGEDLVGPVTRWNLSEHYHGVSSDQYCDAGALLERIDEFDPGFFNISPKEAAYMDPQQRLFLEECWNALDDAGLTDRSLDGAPVSIYVGCEAGDYDKLFDAEPTPQSFWGNAPSIIPARISYHLNLKGPAIAIDTACSSSLVAIHSACDSLRNHDVDMSIAGGVFVQSTPDFYLKSNRANMLSKSGKCHTFDERADGFVPGEGVGVVVLKRLDDAVADGDRIYGVIKASGINQDGTSNGITAPSSVSQESLIKQTYEKYNINPEDIQFVEAHGTGTSLGDPIEFEALSRAFRHYTDRSEFSAIGSVKTNLGHAATAAGMAGVFKILLSLKHKKIPPSLNFSTGNRKIQFEGSPFYVNTSLSNWVTENDKPRKAAISSFGFSGTNAHIVIEEAPPVSHTVTGHPEYLICLSAKTPEQLKARARDLLGYVRGNKLVNCLDLSYTLLARRSHFEYRLSMVVRHIDEIEKYLLQWMEQGGCLHLYENINQDTQRPLRNGYSQYATDYLQASIQSGNVRDYKEALGMFAELYVEGHAPDVESIFRGDKVMPVDLPAYPFDRKSIWISRGGEQSGQHSKTRQPVLHPLVQRNESVFGDQVFSSEYSGNEYFLSEHVIHGKRILPGVCFIEMVRASLAMFMPGFAGDEKSFRGRSLLYKGIGWLRPWVYEKDSGGLRVRLRPVGDCIEFLIESAGHQQGDAGNAVRLHCNGEVVWIDTPQPQNLDAVPDNKRFDEESITKDQFYRYFEQCGVDYGRQFRCVSQWAVSGRESLARIDIDGTLNREQSEMLIDPGLLDGVLQSAAVLISRCFSVDQALVPIAVEDLIVHKPVNNALRAHTRILGDGENRSGVYKVDINIYLEDGALAANFRGLSFRPMLKLVESGVITESVERSGHETVAFSRELQLLTAEIPATVKFGEVDHDKVIIVLSNNRATVTAGSDFDSCRSRFDQLARQFADAIENESNGDDQLAARSVYLLQALQLLMAQKHVNRIRLQLVALSDESESQGGSIPSFASSLTAMLKTAELEDPRFECRLIDYRGAADHDRGFSEWHSAALNLANSVYADFNDAYLFVENSRIYREVRHEIGLPGATRDTCPWRNEGVYLISGGAGGIGYAIAEDIVAKVRSARILLLGTRNTEAIIERKLARLNELGGRVSYHSVDVSYYDEISGFVNNMAEEVSRINAILHCAGVTNDGLLGYKQRESLRSVFGAKVNGVVNLDRATRHIEVDQFVLFSSVSAVLGNVGQADYAVANKFLDHFAEYRNCLQRSGQRMGKALSINWPIWGTPGMEIDEPTLDRMYKEWGMAKMAPRDGIKTLYDLMSMDYDNVFVMHGDGERIRRLFDTAQSSVPFVFNKQRVAVLIAGILGVESDEIDPQLHFDEYGLDWVQRNHLVDILKAELKCDLHKDVLYAANNINELCAYIQKHCEQVQISARIAELTGEARAALTQVPAGATAAISRQAMSDDRQPATDTLVEQVSTYLKELVHQQTAIAVEDIDSSMHFERYGIDSLMIVSMTNKLEVICGRLPKTLFFEYNNLTDLSAYFVKHHQDVLKEYFGDNADKSAPRQQQVPMQQRKERDSVAPASVPSSHTPAASISNQQFSPGVSEPVNPQIADREEIAIIGLAGRYPQADSLETFWINLVNGKDSISEIPFERWDHSRYFDERKGVMGKTYSKWGGFIDGVDQFDPLFFNISPHDAEFMDPQERIFLQCVYHALEDAGYADVDCLQPGAVALGRNVGVYVGVMYEEYQLYGAQESLVGMPLSLGGSAASIANRVSFSFNFNGPSLAVDSMCSASLTSINLACESILNGHCDAAIAGGVNLNLHPNKYLNLAQGNFASSDGRCKSFGADANGYVPGEGCGAVILKLLSAALRDSDQIYGLIKASSINHAGKTNGYTVPSPNAQAEVIKQTFVRSGIDVSTISYIEAHGTGTSLGDPIEVAGLSKAFSELTDKAFSCRLGSVKSNIGHCESAAGVAGVTKVLLQMKNRTLVPSLHADALNPNIDFSNSPLQVQKHLEEWKHLYQSGEVVPYRAGISSFGAGGSNAHVLIEEYPLTSSYVPLSQMDRPVPIMLSAVSTEQLRRIAQAYLDWIESSRLDDVSLMDIAYTLQVGRRALAERLVIVARSVPELSERLNRYLSEDYGYGVFSANVKTYRGKKPEHVPTGRIEVEGFETCRWLIGWCTGESISDGGDWFKDLTCKRVSLPVYPFKKERYWYTAINGVSGAAETAVTNSLHPLLHRNVSDFSGIRYESRFSGQETFFRDHKVSGQRILPGVAYLEMAVQSVKFAKGLNSKPASGIILESVIWRKAMAVDDSGCDISVNLTQGKSEKYVDVRIGESGNVRDPSMTVGVLVNDDSVASPGVDQRFSAADAIEKIKSREGQYYQIEPSVLYAEFSAHGIDYGATHQLVRDIFVGNERLLARIAVDDDRDGEIREFDLHPGLMDSSLQIIKAFYLTDGDNRLMVPFSCARIQLGSEFSRTLWVDCRRNKEGIVHNFDIDIWNSKGELCVQLRKFSVMPYKVAGQSVVENSGNILSFEKHRHAASHVTNANGGWDQYLIPQWRILEHSSRDVPPSSGGRTLIVEIGDCAGEYGVQLDQMGSRISLHGDASIEKMMEQIERVGEVDEIVCLAADISSQSVNSPFRNTDETYRKLAENQNNVTLRCFNFIKALLRSGYDNRPLDLKLVTIRSLPVLPGEVVDPVCSGLHGMFGCVSKEYRNWEVRMVDTDSVKDLFLGRLAGLPAMENGASCAYRDGQWFTQMLYPYTPQAVSGEPYRQGGVYVVIGGAGGLGQTWSAMMIKRYQAHIIWIGRREPDEQITSAVALLSGTGLAPWYIPADATDPAQMAEVLRKIKSRHKRINGVVHSALVLKDRGLARMSEDELLSSLATKVDISASLAEVFESENLDFALFFSSLISFTRNPGQSNYAAGSVFEDVFADQLNKHWACKVRVINWGYWGDVGAVSGDSYRQRMEKAGILSIESDAALDAIKNLLNGDHVQLGFIRINQHAKIDGVDAGSRIECFDGSGDVLPSIKAKYELKNQAGSKDKQALDRICALDKQNNDELEDQLIPLLCVQLRHAGIFRNTDAPAVDMGELVSRIRSINPSMSNLPMYESWLRYSIELIQKAGYLKQDQTGGLLLGPVPGLDADALWARWDEYRSANQHNNYVAPKSRLLDAILRALPNILSGKTKSTDVVFPGSSMGLVEGVYKNNEVSDYFNGDVALSVCSAIQSWQEQVPGTRLRILEIGAGTGGTSAGLLKALTLYAAAIDEYCYTDVSRAFLNHAETHYAPEHGYLKTRILNIEKSPLDQGFDPGSYDIIVAAQVLHATENISRTLSNAKVLLKRNGLLILNELSERSVFSHLTFGMLEGWWLYQDAEVRMPFSPGLFSDSWERCLTAVGYSEVYFPTPASHVLGQQIVVATSDGYNKVSKQSGFGSQDRPVTMAEHDNEVPVSKQPSTDEVSAMSESSHDALLDHIKVTITSALSDALKVPVDAIDYEETFSEYGLDSITGVGLAQKISSVLDIELNTTVLFDYVSVDQLAGYILDLSPVLPVSPMFTTGQSDALPTRNVGGPVADDKTYESPAPDNDALLEYVKRTISGALSDALKVPVHMIDPQETFSEYGLDSITGVGVAQKISGLLGVELNTTVLFDYVSVEQLAQYVLELVPALPYEPESAPEESRDAFEVAPKFESGNARQAPVATELSATGEGVRASSFPAYADESIAVIGMSGRFPGCDNVDELWENISNGVDLISPLQRWDMSKYKGLSAEFCPQGGFLSGIRQFDPGFFNISGAEATYMDPQQRLFLQESWKALEDAGYAGDVSFNDKAGVYVGCNSGDYKKIISEDAPAQAFWGNAGSITPARISYYLNLDGPAMAIDTACSSSLVAIHLACQGLWSGELNVALAGGVFVQSTPEFYLSADKAGMLSKRGRCQAFDSSADGFVPSEGVGVVVLKRLKDALADGDHIHGVIKGSGINQDGASNGITAPSAKSQQRLITGVYNRFSIAPEDIQLVEAHGTGTSLGDPIESEGLKASYSREQSASVGKGMAKTCALGSIKSNMGHAITAAGVASVIKVLMSLKNRKLPPTIHFNDLNSKIDLNNSPFYINTRLMDWEQPKSSRRMAAVSSFGFSGTNGHLVLEEAPLVEQVSCEKPAYLFALSARSQEQLKQMAEALVDRCDDADFDVAGASFTLLNGRRHCEHRLAFIAGNRAELISVLQKYVNGENDESYIVGHFDKKVFVKKVSLQTYARECVSRYRAEVSNDACRELLAVIADLHVQGYSLSFKDLFSASEHRRVSLPTYPFSKREYWVHSADRITADECGAADVPLQWMLTKTAYEPCAFGVIEDWEVLVRTLEGKTIYLLGEALQVNELKTLIDQLCAKASVSNYPSVKSMTYGEAATIQHLEILPDYILCVDTLGEEDRKQLVGLNSLFQLIKCAMKTDWNKPVSTYYIYDNHASASGVYVDAMSGFYQSVVQENDLYTFSLIQYDQKDQRQTPLQLLLLEVLQDDGLGKAVEKIQYRDGERFIERHLEYVGWNGARAEVYKNEQIDIQSGKTYLITGGFGPVGRLLCERLVRSHDVNLIVLSRSPMDDEKAAVCAQLSEYRGRVYYYSVDICDREALSRTLDRIREDVAPLSGVIHMARMVHDNLLVAKSWDEFNATIEAKVRGTVNLDECLAKDPLDFFVLFSSIAAFGLRGSSDYGYSAAFQNGYARYRNGLLENGLRSGVAVSQCWAGWTVDRYMPDARMDIIKDNGMRPITINDAMTIFPKTLNLGESSIGLIGVTEANKARKFFHIDEQPRDLPDNPELEDLDGLLSDWLSRKDALPRHELAEMKDTAMKILIRFDVDALSDTIVQKIYSLMFADEDQPWANVKPVEDHKVEHAVNKKSSIRSIVFETIKNTLIVDDLVSDEKLQHYGMDSVSAMQISSKLSNKLGLPIEPIWLLDNPTIDSFSSYLEKKLENVN